MINKLMLNELGLKKLEPIVLKALEENEDARKDDFILYYRVLKSLMLPIESMSVEIFLNMAKSDLKAPPFESVTRCRRHIQELRPELKHIKTAIAREEKTEEYKEYNLSGIGGSNA